MESLELQRIAGGIEKEQCRLFARQAREADARLYDKSGIAFGEARRQFPPCVHRKDRTEMTHGNCLTIDMIMRFMSGLIPA